jgi:hypothetical protein
VLASEFPKGTDLATIARAFDMKKIILEAVGNGQILAEDPIPSGRPQSMTLLTHLQVTFA